MITQPITRLDQKIKIERGKNKEQRTGGVEDKIINIRFALILQYKTRKYVIKRNCNL